MARTNSNIVLHELSGHIGKQLVIKQYANGTVVSRYPDMSNIKPSKKQKEKRSRFSEAVAYARAILRDPQQKAAYQAKLKAGETVYHKAIREYLQSN